MQLLVATLLALVPLCLCHPSGHISTADIHRLVVIPDVHGDFAGAVNSLFLAFKRPDPATDISAEEFFDILTDYVSDKVPVSRPLPLSQATHVGLIQLGDLVDRGPDSLQCIALFLSVPKLLGWPTWILYGNHEQVSMCVPAERNQYCHKRDWGLFGNSPSGRDAAFGFATDPTDGSKRIPLCTSQVPMMYGEHTCSMYNLLTANSVGLIRWGPPMVELAHAFAYVPDATHPATLFVHGGLRFGWIKELVDSRPKMGGDLLDLINEAIQKAMSNLHLKENLDFLNLSSPLWDRSLATWPAREVCYELLPWLLKTFQVNRIVVGHTPQMHGKIHTRCGGQLVLADAMISRWMRPDGDAAEADANPVALLMRSAYAGLLTEMEAVYPSGTENFNHMGFLYGPPRSVLGQTTSPQLSSWQLGHGLLTSVPGVVVHHSRDFAGNVGVMNYMPGEAFVHRHDVMHVAAGLLHTEFAFLPTSGKTEWLFLPGVCLDSVLRELYAVIDSQLLEYMELLLSGIDQIAQSVHAAGFLLGLPTGAGFFESFCVTGGSAANPIRDTGSERGIDLLVRAADLIANPLVKLVNWVGVRRIERLTELELESLEVREEIQPWRETIHEIRANPGAPIMTPII